MTHVPKNTGTKSNRTWTTNHQYQHLVSIKQNMQQMWIQKRRPKTKRQNMDLPTMPHHTPQRHKRSKKHTKRRKKNIFKKMNNH